MCLNLTCSIAKYIAQSVFITNGLLVFPETLQSLLPEARVGGHGYSSRLVCLSVTHESAHLAATALRLQHR